MKKNILLQTSSQTVGPFFAYGLTASQYNYEFPSLVNGNLRKKGMKESLITIEGNVIDGEGKSLDDALIEIWQADPKGVYQTSSDNEFYGFGRVGTGSTPENKFKFQTFKPGKIDSNSAPHINIIVFARGILNHLFTRIYFPDEEEENNNDFLLKQISPALRERLVASVVDKNRYHFDIILQGDNETVFLDL